MLLNDESCFEAFFRSTEIPYMRFDRMGNLLQATCETGIDIQRLLLLDHIDVASCEDTPQIISNELTCFWTLFPVEETIICVGPVLIARPSKQSVREHYYHHGYGMETVELIAEEYQKIPEKRYDVLMLFMELISQLLYKRSLHVDSDEKLRRNVLADFQNEEDILKKQTRDFEYVRRTEQYMLSNVRSGRVRTENRKSNSPDLGIVRPVPIDELRFFKDMIITSLTMVCRASMDGGLPAAVAYPLSDSYLEQIERARTFEEVRKIQLTMVNDYTLRVKNTRLKSRYSRQTRLAIQYISANMNQPLQIKDIAEFLGAHPDSLSRNFKKETGMDLLHYIHDAKIEESKSLLLYSDKDITEIAFIMGFSSASKYITIFKKIVGVTPGQYRKTNY